MDPAQVGYWTGLLMGGAAGGAVVGLVPLFLGVCKNQRPLALGGFFASIAGGMAVGIIGAAIPAGIFSLLLRGKADPPESAALTMLGGSRGRSALAWYLVALFFGMTIFQAVFWSYFMSLWGGKSFLGVLVPAGALFGLTMGIFMTALFTVQFRPGTVRIAVRDREDFRERLHRATAKLRVRLIQENDDSILYEPRAFMRLDAMRLFVEIGADEAVATGQIPVVKWLAKEIGKP